MEDLVGKGLRLRDEIVTFEAGRREEGKTEEFIRYLRGSFNLYIYITFSDGGPDG